MSHVWNLTPGDVVNGHTFVQRAPHPLYRTLQLVIWRMADGSWSHDALDQLQYVGDAEPASGDERRERLRAALLHPEQAKR